MPFVLYGLADGGWAVLALLLAIGGVLMIRAMQALIGNLPWPIGGALNGALDPVLNGIANWFTTNTKQYWGRVSNFFRAYGFIGVTLTASVIAALTHHASQIAHLNNTTIPQAANTAQSNSFAHADSLAGSLQDNLNVSIRTEAANVASLQNNIDGLTNYVNGTFHNQVNNAIAAAASGALAQAHAELATAESNLVARLASDEGIINNLTQLATVTIPSEIQAAIQAEDVKTSSALQASVAALQSKIDDLQSQITTLATTEATALQNAESAIARQASADLSTAEGYAAAQAAAAEAAAQMEIATQAASDASALQTQANAVAVQLETIHDTETIQQANIGTLQDVTSVVIPASIAAVATSVATITAEFAECAVTVCDGPNNLSSLLGALTGGVTLVELVQFFESVVSNPQGEAAAVAGVASGIYNEGHSLIDGLLSL